MVTSGELQPLASWSADPTNADAVVAALANLWLDAGGATAQAGSGQEGGGIVRTRVLNFLAYVDSPGVSERVAAAMNRIAGSHPSRSVLMLAERERPGSSLGASLRAYCHTVSGGGHQLCFDQVELRASGQIADHLPGIATRLLIHDLPTMLWWPGDPPVDQQHFASMAGVCDLLIVDSSEFAAPEHKLRALAEFARRARGRPAVADLNWDRLVEWREVVAQFFDDPSCRACLDDVSSVEIRFAPDPYRSGASAQALLLAGWLGSRLGWEPLESLTDADAQSFRLRREGGAVVVRFAGSGAGAGAAGALEALRIAAAREGHRIELTVSVQEDGSHGASTVTVDEGNPVARGFHFERPSESRLLSEEIESLGADCALAEALAFAVRLGGLDWG